MLWLLCIAECFDRMVSVAAVFLDHSSGYAVCPDGLGAIVSRSRQLTASAPLSDMPRQLLAVYFAKRTPSLYVCCDRGTCAQCSIDPVISVLSAAFGTCRGALAVQVPVPSLYADATKSLTIVIPAYNEAQRITVMLDETMAYLQVHRQTL